MKPNYKELIFQKYKTMDEVWSNIEPNRYSYVQRLIKDVDDPKNAAFRWQIEELKDKLFKKIDDSWHRVCNPRSYGDLVDLAKLLGYDNEWAVNQAYKLQFDVPLSRPRPIDKSYSSKSTYYEGYEEDEYDLAFTSYAEYDLMFD